MSVQFVFSYPHNSMGAGSCQKTVSSMPPLIVPPHSLAASNGRASGEPMFYFKAFVRYNRV